LKPIITFGVNSYVSKEIFCDINSHFDTDRITTSEILFNIPHSSTPNISNHQINKPWIIRNLKSD
jgi:hypothetical protein